MCQCTVKTKRSGIGTRGAQAPLSLNRGPCPPTLSLATWILKLGTDKTDQLAYKILLNTIETLTIRDRTLAFSKV